MNNDQVDNSADEVVTPPRQAPPLDQAHEDYRRLLLAVVTNPHFQAATPEVHEANKRRLVECSNDLLVSHAHALLDAGDTEKRPTLEAPDPFRVVRQEP